MNFFDEWKEAHDHYSYDDLGTTAFTFLSTEGGINLAHFISELNATKDFHKL
jgi:hypothetical protein